MTLRLQFNCSNEIVKFYDCQFSKRERKKEKKSWQSIVKRFCLYSLVNEKRVQVSVHSNRREQIVVDNAFTEHNSVHPFTSTSHKGEGEWKQEVCISSQITLFTICPFSKTLFWKTWKSATRDFTYTENLYLFSCSNRCSCMHVCMCTDRRLFHSRRNKIQRILSYVGK